MYTKEFTRANTASDLHGSHIEEGWAVYKQEPEGNDPGDKDLIAVVDTETLADTLIAACEAKELPARAYVTVERQVLQRLWGDEELSVDDRATITDTLRRQAEDADFQRRGLGMYSKSQQESAEIVDLINQLRTAEGDSVEICSDNADFGGPNSVIWLHRILGEPSYALVHGDSVLDCLRKAVQDRNASKKDTQQG